MPLFSLPTLLFIAFVACQRLLELVLARRNTRRLLARGGREVGAEHYPLIVTLHATWLLALLTFGWQAPLSPPWLAVYTMLQLFRLWILASLGARWTTRIIIIDEPRVRRGPYRFLPHPNYLLVAAELIAVPMALGLPLVALVFTVLNAIILRVRIAVESQALAQSRPAGAEPLSH